MLTIRLFGPCEVRCGKGPSRRFPTEAAKALFTYLVLNRSRLHTRESLTGVFWGDHPESKARKCLRTELWRLRRTVEPVGTPRGSYVVLGDHELGFNTAARYWLDVEEFERRLAAAQRAPGSQLTPEQARLLEEAVGLYRGDLLEGVYDDWCCFPRDHYKSQLRGVLERLMRYHQERREWEAAIEYGQRLLQQDPLLEHVHRSLMSCLYASGDRSGAIRQYDTCVRLLSEDLNVGPMSETEALAQDIKAGRVKATRPQALTLPMPDRASAELLRLEADLEAAQSLLTWGIQELRRMKSPPGRTRFR